MTSILFFFIDLAIDSVPAESFLNCFQQMIDQANATALATDTESPNHDNCFPEAAESDLNTLRTFLECQGPHEESDSLLVLASSAGCYELVHVLLDMRQPVDDRGAKGDLTPLMAAASGGHEEIVRLLLHHLANPNLQTLTGDTALHISSKAGHEGIVKALIEAGADLEKQNESGHTPLMDAAGAGHLSLCKILVEAGAGVNAHSDDYKESALTLAAYKGHIEVVQYLLDVGSADPEHRAEELHTALMEASMDGHTDVARLLIDRGAQVNMPPDSFESPLTLAACGAHIELAKLLLERNANVDEANDEGYMPLMEAAREGHVDMVKLLLEHGANVNAQAEETQETALTLACGSGYLDVVETLVEAGANVELGPSTPLMEASQEGHEEIVRYLLKMNVSVDAKSVNNDTAFTMACENGHTAVAELLLAHGAELEHESEGGRTPLMKAARAGHVQTVRMLISKGASVNRQTSNGEHNVLSIACYGGHYEVVKTLLAHKADPSFKLKDGSTMIIEAAKGGHMKIVELLYSFPDGAGTHPFDIDNSPSPPLQTDRTVQGTKRTAWVPKKPSSSSSPPPHQHPVASLSNDLQQKEAAAMWASALRLDLAQATQESAPLSHESSIASPILANKNDQNQQVATLISHPMEPRPPNTTATQAVIMPIATTTTFQLQFSSTQTSAGTVSHGVLPSPQLFLSPSGDYTNTFDETMGNEGSYKPSLSDDDQSDLKKQSMSLPTTALSAYSQGLLLTTTGSNSNVVESNQPLYIGVTHTGQHLLIGSQNNQQVVLGIVGNPPVGTSSTSTTTLQQPPTATLIPATSLPAGALQASLPVVAANPSTCISTATMDSSMPTTATVVSSVAGDTSTTTTSVSSLPTKQKQTPQSSTKPSMTSSHAGCPRHPHANLADLPSILEKYFKSEQNPELLSKFIEEAAQCPEGRVLKERMAALLRRPKPSQPMSLPISEQTSDIDAVALASPQVNEPCSTNVSSPVTSATVAASQTLQPVPPPLIDLNAQTESNHDTALTLACAGGYVDLVKYLIDNGADIEHRDKKGFTPLILAAMAGHTSVCKLLLDHGAKIEAEAERTKDTALSLACSGGRFEVVQLLLEYGANKEHRNVSDYTPLSLAASGGFCQIIKLLLDHGAEINSRTGSKLGISPLMLASMNGHTAAVRMLLDNRCDVNAQIETNRNTALTLACFQGRHEVVQLLLEHGANIEHRAKTGLTPLMEAASGGYVEVGKILIHHDAEVNAQPVPLSRDTTLNIAADKGHAAFVQLLLENGAAVDVKNKKGCSPLWLASYGGHLDVVKLLVNADADANSDDNRKISCLMAAFRRGHIKVVNYLVNYVKQFPSDQECERFMSTLSEQDLLNNCRKCLEIIGQAKEQQAAEASRNAKQLLEIIALEKKREEAKQAKKREKRKRKKDKQKGPKTDSSKNQEQTASKGKAGLETPETLSYSDDDRSPERTTQAVKVLQRRIKDIDISSKVVPATSSTSVKTHTLSVSSDGSSSFDEEETLMPARSAHSQQSKQRVPTLYHEANDDEESETTFPQKPAKSQPKNLSKISKQILTNTSSFQQTKQQQSVTKSRMSPTPGSQQLPLSPALQQVCLTLNINYLY